MALFIIDRYYVKHVHTEVEAPDWSTAQDLARPTIDAALSGVPTPGVTVTELGCTDSRTRRADAPDLRSALPTV